MYRDYNRRSISTFAYRKCNRSIINDVFSSLSKFKPFFFAADDVSMTS